MEIGSEFSLNINSLNYCKNNIFNYLKEFNTCYFDTGRSAIKSIKIQKGKILLPEYICKSVIDCFNSKNILFYKLKDNYEIDLEDLLNKLDNVKTIFIMHYFGCIQNAKTLNKIKKKCKEKSILIIEDTTHSIFSKKTTIGDYMVCSLRKWFPIAKGGVVYSKKKLLYNNNKYRKDEDNTKVYAMILKDLYLNSKINSKELFLDIFNKCEDKIDKTKEIFYMSDLSKFLLSCYDIKDIKTKRISNYTYLIKELNIKPANDIKEGECPFVYLIRYKNRDNLRKYLIDNSIYCPVHWPECSKNELSIPIDNRYDSNDMKYVVKCINKHIKYNR